jgi:hypothetical protein
MMTGTKIYNCPVVTFDSEPIVHTINAFSDSSVPIYCNMPTTAEIAEPSIMPRIRITLILLILRESAITIRSITAEPIHAIPVTPISYN